MAGIKGGISDPPLKKSAFCPKSTPGHTERKERPGKGAYLLKTQETQHFSHCPDLTFQGDAFRRSEGDVLLFKQRTERPTRVLLEIQVLSPPKHTHKADI